MDKIQEALRGLEHYISIIKDAQADREAKAHLSTLWAALAPPQGEIGEAVAGLQTERTELEDRLKHEYSKFLDEPYLSETKIVAVFKSFDAHLQTVREWVEGAGVWVEAAAAWRKIAEQRREKIARLTSALEEARDLLRRWIIGFQHDSDHWVEFGCECSCQSNCYALRTDTEVFIENYTLSGKVEEPKGLEHCGSFLGPPITPGQVITCSCGRRWKTVLRKIEHDPMADPVLLWRYEIEDLEQPCRNGCTPGKGMSK